MASRSSDPLSAVTTIYNALKDLDDADRQRILRSALSLLGMDAPAALVSPSIAPPATPPPAPGPHAAEVGLRPKGLTELVQEKNPGTSPQRIALFAYYRERYDGQPRFKRTDLKAYFATAKLQPPSNYDRDFAKVVHAGWIHEDGEQSYLTSKGVEAVEQGFAGERTYSRRTSAKSTAKKKKAKRTKKKASSKSRTKRKLPRRRRTKKR